MRKGILITILVLVIIIIFLALGAGYVYMQFTREPHVAGNSFLKINLSGEIVDSDDSFLSKKHSIRDLWYHLERARIDNRIKGVLLKISYLNAGWAVVEDTGRIIKNFRKSGKKVYAYIEGGGLREYFLATFADKVYAFKGGDSLILNGLAAEAIFLKKTFSNLGIKAEYYHIGEYKTGANMFTEDHLTPAHKESLQKLLDDIFESTLEKIAGNRNIPKEVIKKIISEFSLSSAACVEAHLIDRLVYEDEIIDDLEKEHKIIDFNIYKETGSPLPYLGQDKIAVIFAAGEIHSGCSGGKSLTGGNIMGAGTVTKQLRAVSKNRAVKAVVLRIDSPGGSPFASDAIRREVELLVKKKPLIISMSNLGASGGYQLSLSASKILVLPQTITGSIGVLGGKFIFKGLYDKVGLKKALLKTTEYADWFSDYRGFSTKEKKKFMTVMRRIYDSFVSLVAKNRDLDIEAVEKIARGQVWAGNSAVESGLVDRIGGLLDAIDEAKKLAKIPAEQKVGVKVYPRKKSLWDTVYELMGVGTEAGNPVAGIKAQLSMFKRFFPALLLPYRIEIN